MTWRTFKTMDELMAAIVADKAALRERERNRPWHEKVAIIERMRDTAASARESMKRAQAAKGRPPEA